MQLLRILSQPSTSSVQPRTAVHAAQRKEEQACLGCCFHRAGWKLPADVGGSSRSGTQSRQHLCRPSTAQAAAGTAPAALQGVRLSDVRAQQTCWVPHAQQQQPLRQCTLLRGRCSPCGCPSAGRSPSTTSEPSTCVVCLVALTCRNSLRQASCCTLPQPHRALGLAAADAREALVALYGAWRAVIRSAEMLGWEAPAATMSCRGMWAAVSGARGPGGWLLQRQGLTGSTMSMQPMAAAYGHPE